MVDASDLNTGQRVYDTNTSVYEVVEVMDEVASEVIAKEAVTDRGHTIHSERTVADLNQDFPSDDSVVRVRNLRTGHEVLWPLSRVEVEMEDAFGD